MKKISLKKALELFGAEDIEIHKEYRYRSGFFNKEGQLYYFSVACNGCLFSCETMIRTAKNRKDYTGGDNTYPLTSFLSSKGFYLDIPLTKKILTNAEEENKE